MHKKTKYSIAIVACIGIVIIYVMIGVVLGWDSGGGILPMTILFAALVATWKGITKCVKTKESSCHKDFSNDTQSCTQSETIQETDSDIYTEGYYHIHLIDAEAGDSTAQFNLGFMFANGKGVAQDYAEAVSWYCKAANQGNVDAQKNLGMIYEKDLGMIMMQDYGMAAKWYTKAAEQGDVQSQFKIAKMYSLGQGVPKDYNEAMKWYVMSAEQGHVGAMLDLGKIYSDGNHIKQDYKEAVVWYKKAAEQEHASAQYNLGLMYYYGEGVIEDYIEAYKWILLAGMNGQDVSESKALLKKDMTNSQIAEAQRLAKAFVPKSEITGDKEDVWD